VKNRTATLATGVNWTAETILLLIVAMTFRPTVHAPRKAKPTNSAAAVVFRTRREPTAGPNATPVDDPPMLKPTNTATAIPAMSSSETIASPSGLPSLVYSHWRHRRGPEPRNGITGRGRGHRTWKR
jgi:hypothetical protein